jgi:uncharacterized protein YdhG (YjbR/CyaY superfamily)
MEKFDTIDDYISSFPAEVRDVLTDIRRRLHATVPGMTEGMGYGMPTLQLDGKNLVHFAGWKKHLSIYPMPEADESLAAELAPYVAGKGTLRFPLRPIPDGLLERIILALLATRSR